MSLGSMLAAPGLVRQLQLLVVLGLLGCAAVLLQLPASQAQLLEQSSLEGPPYGEPIVVFPNPSLFPYPDGGNSVLLFQRQDPLHNQVNLEEWLLGLSFTDVLADDYSGQSAAPIAVSASTPQAITLSPVVIGYGTAYDTSNVLANFQFFVLGGQDLSRPLQDSLLNSVYSCNGATVLVDPINPAGLSTFFIAGPYAAPWSPRAWPSATGIQQSAPNSARPSLLVMMGGETSADGTQLSNEVWLSFDQATSWQQQTGSAAFSPRSRAAVINLRGTLCQSTVASECILLVGGRGSDSFLNDVWLSSDAGLSFSLMNPAAAFSPRAQMSLTTSSRTLGGSDPQLIVMAGGYVGSVEQLEPLAEVWLSYDGGWSWLPLLSLDPSNANYPPLALLQPWFDNLVTLRFFGGQGVPPGSNTTIATPTQLTLTDNLIDPKDGLADLQPLTLASGAVLTGLSDCATFGLVCFPGPALQNGSYFAGQLQFMPAIDRLGVSCPYVASGCACLGPPDLLTLPSYQNLSSSVGRFTGQAVYSVSCTEDPSLAADGFLFDSTSAAFAPFVLQCQGGLYPSLPPVSYCTAAYLPEVLQANPGFLCQDGVCPSIQCPLPASGPANGGYAFVTVNSGQQLTTSLHCPNPQSIYMGQLSQTCSNGIFTPYNLGQCVQFPPDACRVVSASGAVQALCAVNEIVVGGGGDCSSYDEAGSVVQRSGLTVSQPLPSLQGWQAVCVESTTPPVTVYARCCLADNNTFTFVPDAYSSQSELSFNRLPGSSFQQCLSVSAAANSGAGSVGQLICPYGKTLVASGAACLPYQAISLSQPTDQVTETSAFQFSCDASPAFPNSGSGGGSATGVCCDSFFSPANPGVCVNQMLQLPLDLLVADDTVQVSCPTGANGLSGLIMNEGLYAWPSAFLSETLNSSAISFYQVDTVDGQPQLVQGMATWCALFTWDCCALLPPSGSLSTTVDFCPEYPTVPPNGIGLITSSQPASPTSFGAVYTLSCPTPYTLLQGAEQITCGAQGGWQGYTRNGTLQFTLGTCEVVDDTQCITVDARASSLPSICQFECGCYFDLSALAPVLTANDSDGRNYQYLTCGTVPLGVSTSCGAGIIACLLQVGHQPVSIAASSPIPSSIMVPNGPGPFSAGDIAMVLEQADDGCLYETFCGSISVFYVCDPQATVPVLTVDSGDYHSPVAYDQSTYYFNLASSLVCGLSLVASGRGLTADEATQVLQCPSTFAVPYLLTEVSVTCGGNTQNPAGETVYNVTEAFPLLASSKPVALDTWEALCFSNDNYLLADFNRGTHGAVQSLARFYSPTLMRGLCCPVASSPVWGTCRVNPNLTCNSDELALLGGANCNVPDTSFTPATINSADLAASFNLGLFAATAAGTSSGSQSVIGSTQLNQWSVQCASSVSGLPLLPAFDSVSGQPDVASVCCQNPLLLQPTPAGLAVPPAFIQQQQAVALSSAQLSTDFLAVFATLQPEVSYQFSLTVIFQEYRLPAFELFFLAEVLVSPPYNQLVVTTEAATSFVYPGQDWRSVPPLTCPALLTLDYGASYSPFRGLAVFTPGQPESFFFGGIELPDGTELEYSPSALVFTHLLPDSETRVNSVNFFLSLQSPYNPPAPPTALSSTAAFLSSFPLQEQVCYATTSGSCQPGEILLASSFQCQSGVLLSDLAVITGSASIQTHSRLYSCGKQLSPTQAAQYFSGQSGLPASSAALCCSAFDLCELQQPLPTYVQESGLQSSFPDGQSSTVSCQNGYAFPGLVQSIVITCAISADGVKVVPLPSCSATACPTLLNGVNAELPGGNGRLSALTGSTGDIVLVQCDAGYAIDQSAPPSLTCTGSTQVGGQGWVPAPPGPTSNWCVLADAGLTRLTVSFPSQYSYSLHWTPFAAPPTDSSAAPSWNLTHQLIFPEPAQVNAANAAESGLLLSSSVILPIDTYDWTWTVDKYRHIEGAIVQVELYAFIPRYSTDADNGLAANSTADVPPLFQSQIVAPVVELPCGCDVVNNPAGFPQQLQLVQTLDSSNALSLSFLPQSLCNPNYQVVQVNETTGLVSTNSIPLLQTYYAENADSCPYLTLVSAQVGQVTYQTAGQVANYCVTAIPFQICAQCVPFYIPGPIPPFGSDSAPDITSCAAVTLLYWVSITGAVTTPGTAAAPAPVGGVNCTALLVDGSGAARQLYDPLTEQNVTVSSSALTGSFGQYALQLTTPLLFDSPYVQLAVSCSRVDLVDDDSQTVLTPPGSQAANLTYNNVTLAPFSLLQLQLNAVLNYSDGSSLTTLVSNASQLSVTVTPSCAPPSLNHTLTTAPVTQLAAQSPYQMCAIMRGAASQNWTVAIFAVIVTQSALVGGSTAPGAPVIGAGYPISRMFGYRVFTFSNGTSVNRSFVANTTSAPLLYLYGSQQNAYTPSRPLGYGNDQPSTVLHVLDADGVQLLFPAGAPLEPFGVVVQSLPLAYSPLYQQYWEGNSLAQGRGSSFSSITYTPLAAGRLQSCTASAAPPAPLVFSPAVESSLYSKLLGWFPFDYNVSDHIFALTLAAAGSAAAAQPQVSNGSAAAFGAGSLLLPGSGAYLTLPITSSLPYGATGSITSFSLWVQLAGFGSALQPLLVLRNATTDLLVLGAADNGSATTVALYSPLLPAGSAHLLQAALPDGDPQRAQPAWTHVVLSVDAVSVVGSAQLSLWLNGSLLASGAYPSTAWQVTALDVGGSSLVPAAVLPSLSGRLDELMLLQLAPLTSQQVQQLFHYDLQYNAGPQYPLGLPVRAPVSSTAPPCTLSNAQSLTQTVKLTVRTNTTTLLTSAAGATRSASVVQSSSSRLSWSLGWSPAVYAALSAQTTAIRLDAANYSGCAPSCLPCLSRQSCCRACSCWGSPAALRPRFRCCWTPRATTSIPSCWPPAPAPPPPSLCCCPPATAPRSQAPRCRCLPT